MPRSADDNHNAVLTYAEVKAIADGNPILMEQIKLEQELKRLKLQRGSWEKDYALEQWDRKNAPHKIQQLQHRLGSLTQALRMDWVAEIRGIPVRGLGNIVELLNHLEPGLGTVGTIRQIRLVQDGKDLELLGRRIRRSEQSLEEFFTEWLPGEIERTQGEIQKYQSLLADQGSRTFPQQGRMDEVSQRLREIAQLLKPALDSATVREASFSEEDDDVENDLNLEPGDLAEMDWGSLSPMVINSIKVRPGFPEWLDRIKSMMPEEIHLKRSNPQPPTEHRFVQVKGDVLQGCLF